MLDYATGKWAPARFHNYLTGQWIEGTLPADVTIPVGTWDAALGRTYVQIAREGWGEQKSQYGGADPALQRPGLIELSPVGRCAISRRLPERQEMIPACFSNAKSHIDTGITRASHGWQAARRPNGSPTASAKFRAA